jgi:hypothetical protein
MDRYTDRLDSAAEDADTTKIRPDDDDSEQDEKRLARLTRNWVPGERAGTQLSPPTAAPVRLVAADPVVGAPGVSRDHRPGDVVRMLHIWSSGSRPGSLAMARDF